MTLIRRALSFSAMAAFAVGVAGASTIIDSTQTATGGTFASFSLPPNATSSVTFSQFNQAAANASIVCPSGYVCSTASLYEIDLGLNANTSGGVNVINSNGSNASIQCLTGIGGAACPTGSSATGANAVAIIGQLSLTGTDPLTNPVVSLVNATAYTVNTNSTVGSFSSKKDILSVPSGTTSYSGSATASDPLGEIYSTADGGWAAEAAAYSGAGNVLLQLALSGQVALGAQDSGIGTSNNTDTVGGTVIAQYLFSYTETSTSTTPEPTTMLLMGGALLGAGLIRRRHVKQS